MNFGDFLAGNRRNGAQEEEERQQKVNKKTAELVTEKTNSNIQIFKKPL
jgi:hypothetical protein